MLQAVFAGPDDSETCDGCEGAVNDNPYAVDEVPEPGEFECQSRCRHIVQLIGDDESGDDQTDGQTYDWNGSAGFTENPIQEPYDFTTQAEEEKFGAELESVISSTPGYDEFDHQQEYIDTLKSNIENYLTQPSADLFGAITDFLSIDEEEGASAEVLAQCLFDTGLVPDDVITELGLDAEESAKLVLDYDTLMGDNLTQQTALDLLSVGDVEQLTTLAENSGFEQVLRDIASEGFDDSNAEYAYYISEVIGGSPYLDQNDGRWYLSLRESMREVGTASSGNYGHAGVPGKVGGSAPSAGKDRPIDPKYLELKNDPVQGPKLEAIVKDNLPFPTSIENFNGELYHNMDDSNHANDVRLGKAPFYMSTSGVYGPGLYFGTMPSTSSGYGEFQFNVHIQGKFATYTNKEYNDFQQQLNTLPGVSATLYGKIDSYSLIASALADHGLDGIKIIDPYGQANEKPFVVDWNVSKADKITMTQRESEAPTRPLYILFPTSISKAKQLLEVGTASSGNYGHAGVPGKVGGSATSATAVKESPLYDKLKDDLGFKTFVERSITNELTGVQSENFDGTLYHNTDNLDRATAIKNGEPFFSSASGYYGPGLYLSASQKGAREYGEHGFAVHVAGKLAVMDDKQYTQIQKDEYMAVDTAPNIGYDGAPDEEATKSLLATVLMHEGYSGIRITNPYGKRGADYVADFKSDSIKGVEPKFFQESANYADSVVVLFHKQKLTEVGTASSGDHGHVGRPGEVGGSGSESSAQPSMKPGTHVEKVSDAPGEYDVKTSNSFADDAVVHYTGFPTDTRIKNSVLKEIDKNIDQIPEQVRSVGEVFFTNSMYHFSMSNGRTSLANSVALTLSYRTPTIIGINSNHIAMHTFEKSNFSVADRATSTSEYARLITDHEMGHALYNSLSYGKKHEFDIAFDNESRAKFTKYAESNSGEAFAEAYAAYVNKFDMPKEYEAYIGSITNEHRFKEADQKETRPLAYACGFGHGPTYHIYKDRIETIEVNNDE